MIRLKQAGMSREQLANCRLLARSAGAEAGQRVVMADMTDIEYEGSAAPEESYSRVRFRLYGRQYEAEYQFTRGCLTSEYREVRIHGIGEQLQSPKQQPAGASARAQQSAGESAGGEQPAGERCGIPAGEPAGRIIHVGSLRYR